MTPVIPERDPEAEMVERVALKLWCMIAPDVRPELREVIWNGTHNVADSFLSDADLQCETEDADGNPIWKPFLCPVGRNTLRKMARAALKEPRT